MENVDFFINTLRILPENAYCSFLAPSLENQSVLKIVSKIESDFSKVIILNSLNILSLSAAIESHSEILQSFHYIEIKSIQNKKLFEAWDGVDFSYFSKDMEIPSWFEEKYFNNDMYNISSEW